MAISTMPNPSPPISNVIEVGTIIPFGGSTIPSKWLACDGTLIGRSDYTDLFDTLGTIWGGGDGSTTFALPNLNGRTIIGVGESTATGHTAHTAGQLAGEEKHVLSVAELASHAHSFGIVINSTETGVWNDRCASGGPYGRSYPTVGANGSNSAHNTMMPYAACTYIIYTGVE